MADIEIEIDGRKLMAKSNQTVIQVADDAGIYIPRFCYHKQLTIPANCRMCLVEIEKAPKTLPACATPVTPGMKVFTKSSKTIAAQRAVMEFLLINHPLDCPICDQGGECELQDLSMGYGSGHSHYTEEKRAVADQDLGPLIATEMTRCIYCTRCVRFGEEVAGLRELGAIGRGEFTEISTYIQHAIKSEISGNIIDLCPVGALTNKPYRFTARPWELDQSPAISPHDCVGSNLNIHTRYGIVMRAAARENQNINQSWIADRDRYSCHGLYHEDRLAKPLVKIDGEWQIMDWQKALMHAASGLQEALAAFGGDKLGALASPNSTLEEFYLLQKLMRALDSPHIDHRLRECDSTDQAHMPAFPGFNVGKAHHTAQQKMAITDIGECDAIVIIGANIQKEQPMIAVQVRKAALKGATVLVLNSVDYQFNFAVTAKKIVAPHLLPETLSDWGDLNQNLQSKTNICFLFGSQAMHHPQSASLRYLAANAANKVSARLCFLTDGANSAGAWLSGAIPHRKTNGETLNHPGLSAYEMLEKPRKIYVLLNVEPDLDFANASLAKKALQDAKFVVALSTFRNPLLEEYAQVILPISPFTETSGTFVNATGDMQSFKGGAKPFELARPAWKVLSVLGRFLLLDGFEFASSEAVKKELHALKELNPLSQPQNAPHEFLKPQPKAKSGAKLSRIGEIPIYAVDSLVRRSEPLQKTQEIMEGDVACVRIHPETANALGLKSAERVRVKQPHSREVILPLVRDLRIAKDAVWVAGGIEATKELGDLFGEIELEAE